jgi:hypothetical protein
LATTWITIALADLKDFLVGAQVNAINSAALDAGQSARFTNVMTAVVNSLRVNIESCNQNQLSTTALTIPPSLKEHACLFIIESLQNSIPGLKLTDDQRRRVGECREDIQAVRKCELKVETPADPLEPASVQGNSLPSITERTRYFDRDSQDGL